MSSYEPNFDLVTDILTECYARLGDAVDDKTEFLVALGQISECLTPMAAHDHLEQFPVSHVAFAAALDNAVRVIEPETANGPYEQNTCYGKSRDQGLIPRE